MTTLILFTPLLGNMESWNIWTTSNMTSAQWTHLYVQNSLNNLNIWCHCSSFWAAVRCFPRRQTSSDSVLQHVVAGKQFHETVPQPDISLKAALRLWPTCLIIYEPSEQQPSPRKSFSGNYRNSDADVPVCWCASVCLPYPEFWIMCFSFSCVFLFWLCVM